MATDSVSKLSTLGRLNVHQQAFAHEYIVDLNATQAAKRAGYSAKTTKAQGSRLLTHVDVKLAIEELIQERQVRTQIDQDWIIEHLVENVEKAAQARPVLDNQGEPTGEYR